MIAVPASVIDRIAVRPAVAGREVRSAARGLFRTRGEAVRRDHAPAPPSATMSVPDRYWCYTQLGPTVARCHLLRPLRAPPRNRVAWCRRGPERWLRHCQLLRPELELDPNRVRLALGHDPWVRGGYSARSAAAPLDTDELASAASARRVCRRAHGRGVARADGRSAPQRRARRPSAAGRLDTPPSFAIRPPARPSPRCREPLCCRPYRWECRDSAR